MKAINFPQANRTYTAPAGSDMYDLRAFCDGQNNVFCMQLSDEELDNIRANEGRLWVSVMSGPNFFPIAFMDFCPFPNSADAYHAVPYFHELTNAFVWVWNSIDAPAPLRFRDEQNRTFHRVDDVVNPKYAPRLLGPQTYVERNNYYIRHWRAEEEAIAKPTPFAANEHGAILCKVSVGAMSNAIQHEHCYALAADCWDNNAKPRGKSIALIGGR